MKTPAPRIIQISLLAVLSLSLFLTGCKQPGCTDPLASNYDVDAIKNDGTCLYDTATTGTFRLNVEMTANGAPFALNQNYTDPFGHALNFSRFRFYMSKVTLIDASGNETLVKDVELVDAGNSDTQIMTVAAAPGDYVALRFGIGLDSALNHTDPVIYPSGHPMSSLNGTFWSWASQYIFVMIDGTADTTSAQTGQNLMGLVYHVGTDSLFRQKTLTGLDLPVLKGQTTEATVHLEIMEVLNGPSDTIRYWQSGQAITHTVGTFSLAERVANNFEIAIH